jgi:hypothetical protein
MEQVELAAAVTLVRQEVLLAQPTPAAVGAAVVTTSTTVVTAVPVS